MSAWTRRKSRRPTYPTLPTDVRRVGRPARRPGGRRMAARPRRRAHSTSRWATCRPGSARSIPDAKLFVVCHLGGRSQRVAQYLARNGYAPVNVNGGMQAWARCGTTGGHRRRRRRHHLSNASLGWSDDPGVFPVRDAVECARPAARLVPAVQRHPAGAVGRTPAFGVERTSDRAADAPRAVRTSRRGCRRDTAGSRCAPAPPPPARRRQRNLGPTPRYPVIPRWGLVERFDTADFEQQAGRAAGRRLRRCAPRWSRRSRCSASPRWCTSCDTRC